jgi:hypothetical protein
MLTQLRSSLRSLLRARSFTVVVLATLGIGIGGVQPLAHLLYGVAPFDAVTFAAVGLLLFGVALAASLGPAGRAARTDPVITLRLE